MEQLALIMAVLMSCQQLLPNFSEYIDQPIKGSYLVDLHAFLYDVLPKTRGRIAEKIVFLLVRELSSSTNQFNDLIAFLKTALDYKSPPLYVLDGFTNGY